MLTIYRSLAPKEKAFVWAAAVALVVFIIAPRVSSAGIVAGAQVAAAIGTLILAGLAFAQVRELRETRLAESAPQVIVEADYDRPPFVYIVVRNIGKGPARDISFVFSAPIEAPESQRNPLWVPLTDQGYFSQGLDFLAPGAEIRNLWGSMISLAPFLDEQGFEGVTITARYKSLEGRSHESTVTINPLLIRSRLRTREKGIKEIAEATEQLAEYLSHVVQLWNYGELQVSTASERERRERQEQERQESEEEGS